MILNRIKDEHGIHKSLVVMVSTFTIVHMHSVYIVE